MSVVVLLGLKFEELSWDYAKPRHGFSQLLTLQHTKYLSWPIFMDIGNPVFFMEQSCEKPVPCSSQENNEDCLPCLFIQFCVIENGRRVSKILQVCSAILCLAGKWKVLAKTWSMLKHAHHSILFCTRMELRGNFNANLGGACPRLNIVGRRQ